MSRDVTLFRRFPDPENSPDPEIAALVGRLRVLDYAPAPGPQFRDDLRAQLVAIAPRLVAEGEPAAAPGRTTTRTATPPPVTATAEPADAKRLRFGRPLRLVAASVAVLALGLGGAVWKSESALPGDSLYGLKRTSEDVRLSLTTGDTARGHEYLRLASTRVREAHDLLGDDSAMASGSGLLAGGVSPRTVQLVQSTLDAANTDVTHGSSLLGTQAVRTHSAAPLQIMQSWAPGQLQRLAQLASEVGSGPLRTSAQQSKTLVTSALTRAQTLEPRVLKGCVATHTDKLGPSCTDTSTTSTPSITPTTAHPRKRGPGSKTPGTKHATRTGGAHTPSSGPTSPGTGPSGSGGGSHHRHGSSSPTPTPILPTLPTILPSGKPTLPISVSSCGISVSLGPIGKIVLGSCPKGK